MTATQRAVVILGSTGSIGTQALDVIARHRTHFRLYGLACGSQVDLLASQAKAFSVPMCAIAHSGEQLRERLSDDVEVFAGSDAPVNLIWAAVSAARADGFALEDIVVLNGITGAGGLPATLAALQTGATLALANKESLVIGGGLVASAVTRLGQIVPVDSEHSAIFQAMMAGIHRAELTRMRTREDVLACSGDGSRFSLAQSSEVSRIILTASGGPFRGKKRNDLENVTPQTALNHPTWSMGPVVTINSSTLMNKALELIEAAYLFDIEPSRIEPVIHPQSAIHSMVEFCDGALIAQASPPDMRLPIALGLSWPYRLEDIGRPQSFAESLSWDFEPIDHETFPALSLARQALESSPYHPAVMNAANEECVDAFLEGGLPYLGIVDTVAAVLSDFVTPSQALTHESLVEADLWARECARAIISAR